VRFIACFLLALGLLLIAPWPKFGIQYINEHKTRSSNDFKTVIIKYLANQISKNFVINNVELIFNKNLGLKFQIDLVNFTGNNEQCEITVKNGTVSVDYNSLVCDAINSTFSKILVHDTNSEKATLSNGTMFEKLSAIKFVVLKELTITARHDLKFFGKSTVSLSLINIFSNENGLIIECIDNKTNINGYIYFNNNNINTESNDDIKNDNLESLINQEFIFTMYNFENFSLQQNAAIFTSKLSFSKIPHHYKKKELANLQSHYTSANRININNEILYDFTIRTNVSRIAIKGQSLNNLSSFVTKIHGDFNRYSVNLELKIIPGLVFGTFFVDHHKDQKLQNSHIIHGDYNINWSENNRNAFVNCHSKNIDLKEILLECGMNLSEISQCNIEECEVQLTLDKANNQSNTSQIDLLNFMNFMRIDAHFKKALISLKFDAIEIRNITGDGDIINSNLIFYLTKASINGAQLKLLNVDKEEQSLLFELNTVESLLKKSFVRNYNYVSLRNIFEVASSMALEVNIVCETKSALNVAKTFLSNDVLLSLFNKFHTTKVQVCFDSNFTYSSIFKQNANKKNIKEQFADEQIEALNFSLNIKSLSDSFLNNTQVSKSVLNKKSTLNMAINLGYLNLGIIFNNRIVVSGDSQKCSFYLNLARENFESILPNLNISDSDNQRNSMKQVNANKANMLANALEYMSSVKQENYTFIQLYLNVIDLYKLGIVVTDIFDKNSTINVNMFDMNDHWYFACDLTNAAMYIPYVDVYKPYGMKACIVFDSVNMTVFNRVALFFEDVKNCFQFKSQLQQSNSKVHLCNFIVTNNDIIQNSRLQECSVKPILNPLIDGYIQLDKLNNLESASFIIYTQSFEYQSSIYDVFDISDNADIEKIWSLVLQQQLSCFYTNKIMKDSSQNQRKYCTIKLQQTDGNLVVDFFAQRLQIRSVLLGIANAQQFINIQRFDNSLNSITLNITINDLISDILKNSSKRLVNLSGSLRGTYCTKKTNGKEEMEYKDNKTFWFTAGWMNGHMLSGQKKNDVYVSYNKEKFSIVLFTDNGGDFLKFCGVSDSFSSGILQFTIDNKMNGIVKLIGTKYKLDNNNIIGQLCSRLPSLIAFPLSVFKNASVPEVNANMQIKFSIQSSGTKETDKKTKQCIKIHDATLSFLDTLITAKGEISDNGIMNIFGEIVPFRQLSDIVHSIPIVGPLLNPEKKGVVGVWYSVFGKIQNPKVIINPLFVILPRGLHNLFHKRKSKKV
jgi:hypothetical protein